MRKVPKEEIERRLDVLIQRMQENQIDLAIVVQNVDRFYFTGTMQNGVLLVSSDRGYQLCIKRTLESAVEETPLKDLYPYHGTKSIIEFVNKRGIDVKKLGLEIDVLPAFLYIKFKELFPQAEICDISKEIRKIRMIKSHFEIELIREASLRLDNVMVEMKNLIKSGISEKELLPDYVRLIVKKESSPCIRTRQYNMEAIQKYILSGSSISRHSYMDSPSAGGEGVTYAFPGGSGYKKIEPNEPVLIDLVMNFEGYNSDCTRIFAISEIDKKFLEAHEISRECHKIFIDMAKKEANIIDISREIRNIVNESKFKSNFMGGVKFIGHGIGLELDEIPVITDKYDEKIRPGMVIALEPKFIFEDGAAGYETTYLVGENTVEPLNKTTEDIVIL